MHMKMKLNANVLTLIFDGLGLVYSSRCKALREAQERLAAAVPTTKDERMCKRDVVEASEEVEFISQVAQCFRDVGREMVGGTIDGYVCEGTVRPSFDGHTAKSCRFRLEIHNLSETHSTNPETSD